MSIPHRILTTDGTFNKSLTESDSSGDYVTPMSSMADVSAKLSPFVLKLSNIVLVTDVRVS